MADQVKLTLISNTSEEGQNQTAASELEEYLETLRQQIAYIFRDRVEVFIDVEVEE